MWRNVPSRISRPLASGSFGGLVSRFSAERSVFAEILDLNLPFANNSTAKRFYTECIGNFHSRLSLLFGDILADPGLRMPCLARDFF